MPRKLAVFLEVGYAGMSTVEFIEIDDAITEGQLDDLVWDMALQHADMYGYYPTEDMPEDLAEDSDDAQYYVDGIEGRVEEYDSAEHDGYIVGGGTTPKFQDYTH